MPRISVPNGPEPVTDRVWELRPTLGAAANHLKEAAKTGTQLPARLRELIRYRIALANGCLLCQSARDPVAALTEDVYREVDRWPSSTSFDAMESAALEFADRFATDHHSIGDELFSRLRAAGFDDGRLLDLSFFVARFVAFGRLTHVLGLDDSCALPPTETLDAHR